ncbi:MAG: DUF2304 domain-containing protein [Patescibacteria group bacterium]|nr:DUF2304 domain-containing protein [Patescibacteria group bacterium]MDD4611261.1 DUF2304 domain-containing protein [Patescibacteria group bacterium]
MLQQLLAGLIIIFFLVRLLWQKQKKQINANEFVFWLIFWLIALVAIASLKWLDRIVSELGFSGSGIQLLLYIAIAILFYFIFRLRLRLEKMERDITKIIREIAIKEKK